MPYLQLDLPLAVPPDRRPDLARRLAAVYAEVMDTVPHVVTVAFRELGENGVLRNTASGVVPAIVVGCDIRRGRTPEVRLELGHRVAALLEEALGWPSDRVILEFTQHDGDEIYREGRLSEDWAPAGNKEERHG
jgi:phenylpyruvate tautomerase PptA (4-oxalocrotonate tautomerase family)